jgi:transposase InsO family protein
MIDDIHQQTEHSFRRIFLVLNVSRSSYYDSKIETARQREDLTLGGLITRIFQSHKRRYGYRRIADELRDESIKCSNERIRRLMKELGLVAIQPKSYVPRTSDGRADAPSPNLIELNGLPSSPNQIWAGDITHIPTSKGWLYLAVVIDLFTRKIVGWKLARHMRAELVADALENACQSQKLINGAIFHSDRGSQYGSRHFRKLLDREEIEQSMSARANPYDNAWTESVIGTIKAEILQGGRFHDFHDAQTELFDYIESYYNHRRKHSSLGYLSPVQFENQFYQN